MPTGTLSHIQWHLYTLLTKYLFNTTQQCRLAGLVQVISKSMKCQQLGMESCILPKADKWDFTGGHCGQFLEGLYLLGYPCAQIFSIEISTMMLYSNYSFTRAKADPWYSNMYLSARIFMFSFLLVGPKVLTRVEEEDRNWWIQQELMWEGAQPEKTIYLEYFCPCTNVDGSKRTLRPKTKHYFKYPASLCSFVIKPMTRIVLWTAII